MKICPHCGKHNEDDWDICRRCFYSFTPPPRDTLGKLVAAANKFANFGLDTEKVRRGLRRVAHHVTLAAILTVAIAAFMHMTKAPVDSSGKLTTEAAVSIVSHIWESRHANMPVACESSLESVEILRIKHKHEEKDALVVAQLTVAFEEDCLYDPGNRCTFTLQKRGGKWVRVRHDPFILCAAYEGKEPYLYVCGGGKTCHKERKDKSRLKVEYARNAYERWIRH